jgi:hypothetical protein
MEYFAPRDSIERAIANPEATYRDKLIALRDYVAHELEANRCKTCFTSKLRTGDTAALVLRLKTLLDDIESIQDPNEEVDEFEQLISRQAPWGSTPTDLPPPALGG